jgi:uncharacterized PurR-regulated membrane protein YhhQ (DUF165 family)
MRKYADPWLLPTQQCECPGRDLVSEAALHGRRELTFLILSSLAIVASICAALVPDLVDVADSLGLESPCATTLPAGALVMPIAFAAAIVACELFGSRRAFALTTCAAFGAVIAAGFAGGDLTLAAAVAAGGLANVLVFAALRRALDGHHVAVRGLFSLMIASVVGAAVFAALSGAELDAILPIAAAIAAYGCVCAFVGILPLAIVTRGFAVYLRVAGLPPARRRLPPALIVDDAAITAPRPRMSLRFNAVDLAFFDEGEHLADEVSAS